MSACSGSRAMREVRRAFRRAGARQGVAQAQPQSYQDPRLACTPSKHGSPRGERAAGARQGLHACPTSLLTFGSTVQNKVTILMTTRIGGLISAIQRSAPPQLQRTAPPTSRQKGSKVQGVQAPRPDCRLMPTSIPIRAPAEAQWADLSCCLNARSSSTSSGTATLSHHRRFQPTDRGSHASSSAASAAPAAARGVRGPGVASQVAGCRRMDLHRLFRRTD